MADSRNEPDESRPAKPRKLRVLVSAYACEPDKGSEPGVGWNWTKQIARFHEAWVITRANNRESIEKELARDPDPNLNFVYYDLPKWLSFWKKKERGLYLYYLLWQIGAYKVAWRTNRDVCFDLVHHLTFGNFWLPTFMPFLGIPFIWGPVGGGERVPPQFRKNYSINSKIHEYIRDIIVSKLKINPFFLYACKRAKVIISRTQETFKTIPEQFKFKTITFIETGIEPKEVSFRENHPKQDNVQILSVGRLIHLKGFDIALKAFSKASKEYKNSRMTIIGGGPDLKRLQSICEEMGISDRVKFTGHLNNNEVYEYMSKSDIFLYPSLKEAGAWVLFEAMSIGMPIVCLDIAGPAEIVSNECGTKIKPLTPEQTINDLADAILRLAKDPELRKKMGEAGRKRVLEHYTWEKKGKFIKEVYERVLGYRLF